MANKKEQMCDKSSFQEPTVEQEVLEGEVCFQQEDVERLLIAITEKNRLHEEMSDRLKRLQADFDNFRRRTRQEKEELSTTVAEGILLQLLPVMDNFDRALAIEANANAAAIKSGIEMIYRQFSITVEQLGLTSIKAVGEQFDPQYHEAVMRVEDDKQTDGLIAEELQKGYMVRSKVIRPSMVKVISNN